MSAVIHIAGTAIIACAALWATCIIVREFRIYGDRMIDALLADVD